MFDFFGDYLIPFLFILTVLVFVHELGHYWVARRNGVRIEVFSIGFGPELFGWTDKANTRWKISAIPLGGYVKMFGDSDEASSGVDQSREMTPEEKSVSFHFKSLGARAAIVAAGPIANYVFAVVVFALLFMASGDPAPKAAIGNIQAESAAEAAGLQKGDQIIRLNGKEIKWFEELRAVVSTNPGITLEAEVLRNNELIPLTIVPRTHTTATGENIGFLGVSPHPDYIEYVKYNPLDASVKAVERTADLTMQILSSVGQFITGSRDSGELGGPLRIAQMSGEVAQGGWINIISFMAILSVNLGLINLFPIPMLDGGHLIFYAAEAIRGKPLNATAQEYGFRFGLILVLALMVFATWNDLVHLRVVEFFLGLFS